MVRIFLSTGLIFGVLLAASVPPGYRMERVRVSMRDRIHLDTNVFLPESGTRFPAVLVRTPYGKGSSVLPGYKTFLDHGYAVVVQDVRGRYGSEGLFNPLAREGPDGYDTIDWIARQGWSDGNVAMSGGSYLGFVQWEAALEGNPHLKAIFPSVSGSDPYFDRFYSPGGGFKLGHRLSWFAENLNAPGRRVPVLSSYIWHLPIRTSDRAATGTTLDAYQKLMAHPSYDSFWKKVSVLDRLDKVRTPVFAMGGWYDNYVQGDLAAFSTLSRMGRRPQLVIGPWPHNMSIKFPGVDFGPDSGAPIRRYQWQWFDHVVKSPPSKSPTEFIGPLRIFVMGINRWRDEREWPLARARSQSLYLAAGGELDDQSRDSAADRYSYDPRNPVPTRGGAVCCDPKLLPWGPMDQRPVESRKDVLVYTGPVLRHDLEVTGPVRLVLWVSTSAKDTDFTGKLIDVFPNGEARNLTDGMLRLRYRNGVAQSTLAKPGEIYMVSVDLGVTSNVFLAGHRIRLEVSSSNFPRFDRNPNTGTTIADEANLRVANQIIYHDRRHVSQLVLPVIPPPMAARLTSTAAARYVSKRRSSQSAR